MQWLRSRREDLKEDWANGNFTASIGNEMLARNAAATGACSIINDLLNISYEELGDSADGK